MSPGEPGVPGGDSNQRKKSNGVESANSHLLTREENAVAFRLLGQKCQSLATAVVQIYQSEPQSNHNRWNKRSCGVVCFVKDNARRLIFFYLFENRTCNRNIRSSKGLYHEYLEILLSLF